MKRWLLALLMIFSLALVAPTAAQDDDGEEVILQPFDIAVVFNILDGTLGDPLGPGTHVYNPDLQAITVYYTGQQRFIAEGVDAIEARTADGMTVELETITTYSLDPAQVNTIHLNWQDRYNEGYIRPSVRGIVRDVVATFAAESIYALGRVEAETQILSTLESAFAEQGFLVTDFQITNIAFPQPFVEAIEARALAEQGVYRAEIEAQTARIMAEGERDAAILRAEGEAEALLIYDEMLRTNPLLLQVLFLRMLSDKVRVIVVPGGEAFSLSTQDLLQEAEMSEEGGE